MNVEKQKISYEEDLSPEECVTYLKSIVAGLEARTLKLSKDGEWLQMSPSESIHAEIKAKKKKSRGSIAVSLSWRSGIVDDNPLDVFGSFFPPPVEDQSTRSDKPTVEVSSLTTAVDIAESSVPPLMLAEYLDTLSRESLYEKAQAFDIEGRSNMGKDELVLALCAAASVDELFTHQELYEAARDAGIHGRSSMSKADLLRALHQQLVADVDVA